MGGKVQISCFVLLCVVVLACVAKADRENNNGNNGNGQGNNNGNGQGNNNGNGQGNNKGNGQGNNKGNGQGNGQSNGQGNNKGRKKGKSCEIDDSGAVRCCLALHGKHVKNQDACLIMKALEDQFAVNVKYSLNNEIVVEKDLPLDKEPTCVPIPQVPNIEVCYIVTEAENTDEKNGKFCGLIFGRWTVKGKDFGKNRKPTCFEINDGQLAITKRSRGGRPE